MGRVAVIGAFHWLDEVDTTNRQAAQLAEAGAPEGTVVVARVQTAGRGRMGREWASPEGGLYMTVLLRPRLGVERYGWISLCGGIAAAEALGAMLNLAGARGPWPQLKWPNDVLLGGRKIGGVLGEALSTAPEAPVVLLGLGLNLTTDVASLPERPLFPATTVLAETGVRLEARELAERVVERLDRWYETLQQDGPGAVRRRFSELSAHAGRRVEFDDATTRRTGTDAGLSEAGGLRIDFGDGPVELLSGWIVRILDSGAEAALA